MAFFSGLKSLFLDFLFPRRDAIARLGFLSPERLIALLPKSDLDASDAIALFCYSDPLVKELVWEIKYSGNRALARKLGTVLYDVIMSELEERSVFDRFEKILLLPMPVSDKRRLERGWNQCELLCEALKENDLSRRFRYLPRQLVKIRHTESQTKTATKTERLENLRESMLVQHPPAVAGAFVVLVDDVTTTGATFAEAKRCLNESGAKRIFCVAVAH